MSTDDIPEGVSPVSAAILAVARKLGAEGPFTAYDLAEATGRGRSDVAKHMRKLAALGLIERRGKAPRRPGQAGNVSRLWGLPSDW